MWAEVVLWLIDMNDFFISFFLDGGLACLILEAAREDSHYYLWLAVARDWTIDAIYYLIAI